MKRGLLFCALISITITGWSQTPYIDSLQKIVAKHTRDSSEIRALDHLSSEFARRDLTLATKYVYDQIEIAKAIKTDFGLPGAYSWLVTLHQNAGRQDSALYYLGLMEALVKKYPNDYRAAGNYYNSAGLYYRTQSEYNKAMPYLIEALKWVRLLGNRTSEAGQLLNIGNGYQRQGDLKSATTYHLQALKLFEELKNLRGQSFCLQSLGNNYLALKQYKAAERYFNRSLKLKEELGDRRGMISGWTSLSSMYIETEKLELAVKYAGKSVERSREMKLITEESGALFNMSRAYRDMKRLDMARNTYAQSLVLARKSGDSLLVSTIKSDLALLDNNLKTEEQHLLKNVTVSLEKGDRPTSSDAYHKLALWYSENGNYKKAFENLEQAHSLNDSVRGDDILLQIRNLEESYESEKKEKEIALLKKDQELQSLALSRHELINTLIGIALFSVVIISFLLINRYRVINNAKRLVEIERVRNNIARDLHDDIGSTLSSINILSQVAIREKNDNAQQYLQRIGDQSSRILENMSDMVWSINPQNDSISQVVIKMREFATEILEPKNIEFRFTENVSPDLNVDADKRKNLFLIFKETINNAAKYSGATHIEIALEQNEKALSLKISDNGKGFDENTIKNGNGLRNMRERANAVKGKVILNSTVGGGTAMDLTLPIT